MNNIYDLEKNIEKIERGLCTNFVDFDMKLKLINKLSKKAYRIYYPYKDSEKAIFYVNDMPKIDLYEIQVRGVLRHQDIMGTLFSIGILPSMYGDIVINNNHYYIYIINKYSNYLITNLLMINNNKVKLVKCNNDLLNDYERKYETIEFVISSLRIDSIVARLTHTNRDNSIQKIKDKEVLVNYNHPKNTYNLKQNDVFSIKRYGKYKFVEVKNSTKKGNIIVKIYKYL